MVAEAARTAAQEGRVPVARALVDLVWDVLPEAERAAIDAEIAPADGR
jgi:hypothetical protein